MSPKDNRGILDEHFFSFLIVLITLYKREFFIGLTRRVYSKPGVYLILIDSSEEYTQNQEYT